MTTPRYPALLARAAARARFEAAGQPQALADALAAAGLPHPARPNTSATAPGLERVDWLGPRRIVVSAAMDQEGRLDRQLQQAFARFAAADVLCATDMVAEFALTGPGAAEVLAQGSAVDFSSHAFPPGSVTVTDLWGIAAIVARTADAPDALCVTVDRALSGFVEGWLQTALGLPAPQRPGVMRTAHGAQAGPKP